MAKLILHIGTHKTATTTIQATFAKNQKIAQSHGLTYPVLPNQHHGLVADWINLPKPYHYIGGAEAQWRSINTIYGGTESTVLISTEELSRATKGNRANFAQLREWTSGFDDVQVVCMLREQVSLIQSIFFEVFRKSGQIEWGPFIDTCFSQKEATGVYLDFGGLYDRLLQDFEPEEIVFLPYRPDGKGANPLVTFLNHIGFPKLQDVMTQADANRSPAPLETWLAVLLDRPNKFDPDLADMISPIFEGKKTTMFSNPEYQKVREVFKPLNDAFLARYSGLNARDLQLSEFPSETHMFRNQMTQIYWLKLAKMLRASGREI